MRHSRALALAAAAPVAGEAPQGCLFASRAWDFWLLGGLAILLWIPVYFISDAFSPLQSLAAGFPAAAFMLAYWVNYPHFMASYKLAYGQGGGFVIKNGFQLVVVPLALLAALAAAIAYWEVSIADWAAVLWLNRLFALVGVDTRLGLYPSLGPELLGTLVSFMYFTVGWHYAKQCFGCMMVYARLDGYPMSRWQRDIIRYTLLSTWWLTWLYSNCSTGSYSFYELQVYRLGLPPLLYQLAGYLVAAMVAALVIGVLVWNRRVHGCLPSVNFMVPMAGLMLWHVPLLGDPQYFYMIAFFHSLQYLPFVAKVETARGRRARPARPRWRLLLLYMALVAAGYVAFDFVPNHLDAASAARESLGLSFYLIAALAFINIHHYFIDNVLWRFRNREVRELLFDGRAG